jgi:hypothetical protein
VRTMCYGGMTRGGAAVCAIHSPLHYCNAAFFYHADDGSDINSPTKSVSDRYANRALPPDPTISSPVAPGARSAGGSRINSVNMGSVTSPATATYASSLGIAVGPNMGSISIGSPRSDVTSLSSMTSAVTSPGVDVNQPATPIGGDKSTPPSSKGRQFLFP